MKEFFNFFFFNIAPWVKTMQSFQRGAWVRLYGIPLHAWNESFFKLCVMECGRYLRADSGSVDRDRFDYARVLIGCSSTEIIQRSESLMVDGEVVEVKIVEEWGFNIGEDACLFEEREGSRSVQSNQEEMMEDVEHENEANIFVERILEDLRGKEDGADLKDEESIEGDIGSANVVKVSTQVEKLNISVDLDDALIVASKECPSMSVNGDKRMESSEGSGLPIQPEVQASFAAIRQGTKERCRASSCPPKAARSIASGPWSLEWLSDQHHSEAGVVSSSRKEGKKRIRLRKKEGHEVNVDQKRKKVNGVLRHPVHSLKKVARLPLGDRAAVLQILKKNSRRARGVDRLKKAVNLISKDLSEKEASSGSVDKECNHWVVLHGNEKVMEDDVKNIGAAIGVQLNDRNMFGVLARKGKAKKKGGKGRVVEEGSVVHA